MFSMSSSHQRKAPISEPFVCSECGKKAMASVVENCGLADGFSIKRLRHFRCRSCGARLFDDAAMHRIQQERAEHPAVAAR
jgi:DNA-directed RNA polymerase subunit RPC12/RpoP